MKKTKILLVSVAFLLLCFITYSTVALVNRVNFDNKIDLFSFFKKDEEKGKENSEDVVDPNNYGCSIYEETCGDNVKEEKTVVEEEINTQETVEVQNKELSFTALGEIMMGNTNSSSYTLPYKDIVDSLSKTNYTVANFTTNITNLEKIVNPKSKYIVTKEILNTFNTLGVKGVNIANDHAVDFGGDMFLNTKNILEENNVDIIGLKDRVIYAENNGIKVAFIGLCNEVIGSQIYYEKIGIFMYNMKEIDQKIKEEKAKGNFVVVMTHLRT